MDIKNVEAVRQELAYLNSALRLLGCKWDHLKQRVVHLSEDEYPHLDLQGDPAYAGKSVFKIKVKGATDGGIVPFRAKAAQLDLLTAIYQDMALGIPVFIAILKARQIGFSTVIALLFLALALVKNALDIIVAAHVDASASNLFNIYKFAYRFLPDAIKPLKEKDNQQELKFAQNQSQLKAFVAKEGNMGVSTSYTHAHFSEIALWKQNAPETLATALESIPMMPGVIVIAESTSRGKGNILHDIWVKATEAWANPENRGAVRADKWRPLFYSWMDDETYRLPVTSAFKMTIEEIEFQTQYRCTKEQIAWRREKIKSNTGAMGVAGAIAHFNRENPSDPETAFRAAGNIVFDLDALDWLNTAYRQKPQTTYDAFLIPDKAYHSGYRPMVTPNGQNGNLRIYRHPQKGVEYLLCGDPTRNEGPNPNEAALHVIDTAKVEVVASFSAALDPDEFARVAAAVGWYYNYAFAVIENNNAGITTCRVMYKELNYRNMYMHVSPGKAGHQTSTTIGFSMKGDVRSDAIENAQRFIREYRVGIYDYLTLDEAESFRAVYDKQRQKYKEQAESGKQDNLIIALIIGLYVGNERYRWYRLDIKRKDIPIEIKGELELPDGTFLLDVDLKERKPRLESLLGDY